MDKLKKHKFLILFCVILFVILIVLLNLKEDKSGEYYEEEDNILLKKYTENEYIPVNISYDQMARIYLQDYIYMLLYDRVAAYNMIDSKYREAKFPTFESFDKYIESIMSKKLKEMVVSKYAITEGNDYRDFDIYDSGDNLFIIREKGVMQYTVFFDRYTVDMK